MKWRTAKGLIEITEVDRIPESQNGHPFISSQYSESPQYLLFANAIEVATGDLIIIENNDLNALQVLDKDGSDFYRTQQLLGNEFWGSFEYKKHKRSWGDWYEVRNLTFICSKWMKQVDTPIEEIIEKPKRSTTRTLYHYQGGDRTLNTIAKMNDVTYQSLKTRLDDGLTLDEAIVLAKSRKLKH